MPEQAETVRRIFAWRAEGRSVSWIVRMLDKEHIPGPTGGVWRVSTIYGSRTRRNGILNNELQVGRIVFNRQRLVRNPTTRKPVSRLNPGGAGKTQDIPELRIVDEAAWSAVAAIEGAPEHVAGIRRTPSKRLLSRLLRCGTCGGPFTVVGAERCGCGTARASGTCANSRTISTQHAAAAAPTRTRRGVHREYRSEREKDRAVAAAARAKVDRDRAKVTGRIERLTDMMADGIGNYTEMKGRLVAALAERAGMEGKVEEEEVAPAVALHPNLAEAYRRNVGPTAEALNAPELEAREARLALRSLIELITAEPYAEGRGSTSS